MMISQVALKKMAAVAAVAVVVADVDDDLVAAVVDGGYSC